MKNKLHCTYKGYNIFVMNDTRGNVLYRVSGMKWTSKMKDIIDAIDYIESIYNN